jgi:hypothetical protein
LIHPDGAGADASHCQKGGWLQLTSSEGAAFANQGDCVSYAARGGTLIPKPAATPRERFRDICQSAGGTFSEATNHWRCESSTGLTQATLTELKVACEEAERFMLWSPFGPPFPTILCVEPPDLPPPPM